MVTYLREVKISVYIDTNKATHEKIFELEAGEEIADLVERAREYLEDLISAVID